MHSGGEAFWICCKGTARTNKSIDHHLLHKHGKMTFSVNKQITEPNSHDPCQKEDARRFLRRVIKRVSKKV